MGDEAGTHADMGMYYDFKVDQDGFPYGCKDLDNGGTAYLKRVTNQNTDHGCGFQRHAEPAGSTPLYKIVEEFADNKNAWLKVSQPWKRCYQTDTLILLLSFKAIAWQSLLRNIFLHRLLS